MKFVNEFIDGETEAKSVVGVRHLGRSGAGGSSPGTSAPQRLLQREPHQMKTLKPSGCDSQRITAASQLSTAAYGRSVVGGGP